MSELGGNIRFAIAVAKGIVRDQRARRTVLFFVVLAAMLMAFAGAVLLDRWLSASPLLFLFYWCACLWLTFLSMLLAVHDLLMLRRAAHQERQRLKAEVMGIRKAGLGGREDGQRGGQGDSTSRRERPE